MSQEEVRAGPVDPEPIGAAVRDSPSARSAGARSALLYRRAPLRFATHIWKERNRQRVAKARADSLDPLMAHPAIAMAVVFGKPDPKWGETVCAAVQFRNGGAHAGLEELRDHCRVEMAPHKAPVHWFMCNAFPMTGSGKGLRELAEAGHLRELE